MDVTALISRLRQSLAQCRSEAGMIVSDDELDAVQTARLEFHQEVPPARWTVTGTPRKEQRQGWGDHLDAGTCSACRRPGSTGRRLSRHKRLWDRLESGRALPVE